ncbi:MAG TPA: hypothetical protein VGL77_01060 [Armatimonadota bacterium]|jgi:hypothetical protein
MEHLEHPSQELWNERRRWFESINEAACGDACYLVSEQACALTAEVQATFCAGAWIGVIVLAMTVIDATLRETELPGFQGNTSQLIDAAGGSSQLQELRRRRNTLVHVNPNNPAITVDQQWFARHELELEAKKSVELMFEAFYIGPWV